MQHDITIDKVITGGFCVGCGACRVKTGGDLAMEVNEQGLFMPRIEGKAPALLKSADSVCPFSDASVDESRLGKQLFQPHLPSHDHRVGFYDAMFAGRITDDALVEKSSSGGLTTWAAAQLMRSGQIDGVIHVDASDADRRLFEYSVSDTVEQLYGKTKSRYYTVSFADAVLKIRGDKRRYLFIGVPCFVKAVRLLCREDEVLRGKISYFFALVCGHLKSPAFAELFAWQIGMEPKELAKFDFRVKNPLKAAPQYSVRAWKKPDGGTVTHSAHELYGSNWGHAFFQLKACDACDDVMGELADATFGDAWLPEYDHNWRGTSIVISRSPEISKMLAAGRDAQALQLDDVGVEAVVQSQAGNYRHRWDGLSVRAQDALKKNAWFPSKRIAPGSRRVDFMRKKIVRLREKMAHTSHSAFVHARSRGDLRVFLEEMRPLTDEMKALHLRSMEIERLKYYGKNPVQLLAKVFSIAKKLMAKVARRSK